MFLLIDTETGGALIAENSETKRLLPNGADDRLAGINEIIGGNMRGEKEVESFAAAMLATLNESRNVAKGCWSGTPLQARSARGVPAGPDRRAG